MVLRNSFSCSRGLRGVCAAVSKPFELKILPSCPLFRGDSPTNAPIRRYTAGQVFHFKVGTENTAEPVYFLNGSRMYRWNEKARRWTAYATAPPARKKRGRKR